MRSVSAVDILAAVLAVAHGLRPAAAEPEQFGAALRRRESAKTSMFPRRGSSRGAPG
jgi:hypothetical protein